MKLLNLGCGSKFHKDWVNLDFESSSQFVQSHNLLEGIPFESNSFNVVYHAHVLEHFTKKQGEEFIKECYRVLNSGGIIRVAVPDLEQIARNYLISLEGALKTDRESKLNYEWMMLELFDQVVRTQSGGQLAEYLKRDELENQEFIYSRVGLEARQIREAYLASKNNSKKELAKNRFQDKILSFFKGAIKGKRRNNNKDKTDVLEIAKFRMRGEIHQWMYDRYSLCKPLGDCGFINAQPKSAFESEIPNWTDYDLESKAGVVYKPDSLFVEAHKA